MFEDLDEVRKSDKGRKAASFALAMALEAGMIFAIVITPLIFFSVLPNSELLTFLMASPPTPPTQMPPAPTPDNPAIKQPLVSVDPEKFTPPPAIPKGIPPPTIDDGLISPDVVGISPFADKIIPDDRRSFDFALVVPPAKPTPLPVKPQLQTKSQRIGGDVLSAKLIRQVSPVYPAMAKAARAQGDVILEVEVDEEGNVASVVVKNGHTLLRQAAVDAVKQWKYTPTLLNGEPIPVIASVTVKFTLN